MSTYLDQLWQEVMHEDYETGRKMTGPAVTSLSMRKPEPSKTAVRARILWPALGFPAVIAPNEKPVESQVRHSDATKTICVLLLTDRPYLSKEEVAKYLRYVPWNNRHRRYIEPGKQGSFPETDIAVRSNAAKSQLTLLWKKDMHGGGILFGGDENGKNAIVVKLADYVLDFYKKAGISYLHEVRISEHFSKKLKTGLYHLFWNNESRNEDAPSAEMKYLLEKFAPSRRNKLGAEWEGHRTFFQREYEFEYGSLQEPYKSKSSLRTRSEILHPLFVNVLPSDGTKIGHLTDMHIDIRMNVYEENFKQARMDGSFNNWNTSFEKGYNTAKEEANILLFTGDLIDYGRGHWGLQGANRLGDDQLYHVDRNWFLFYYLLASGNAYEKPVYTVLGNHDWRLNPYPPKAPGAPEIKSLMHQYRNLKTPQEKDQFWAKVHGEGHNIPFSYHFPTNSELAKKYWESGDLLKALGNILRNKKTLDLPHLPSQTNIDSIAWYLMAINPFLDYSFSTPKGQKILMLDWAEDENLLFGPVIQGKSWWFLPTPPEVKKAASEKGQQARNSLTVFQKQLVNQFVESPRGFKIIGMHAPPVGPYPDWYDYPDLSNSRKVYREKDLVRGPKNYATKMPDGAVKKWNGHPIFAIMPSKDDLHHGTFTDYGSLAKEREWFIRRISQGQSPVGIVLAGHIHRNGLYTIRIPGKNEGPSMAGKLVVKGLLPQKTPDDTRYIPVPFYTGAISFKPPLYINTTSAGPRGDFYSQKIEGDWSVDPGFAVIALSKEGKIHQVTFRSSLLEKSQASAVKPKA